MTRSTVSFDVDGHHITGTAVSPDLASPDLDGGGPAKPLLVGIHGGTFTSTYFDVPGHSLLDLATANGFDLITLDRPGYGGSDPLPAGQVTFALGAELLDGAIGQLWATHGGGHPGIVIISHSIGSAITVHLAARRPSWPLLGVALSGISDVAPPHVRAAWNSIPPGEPVELTPEQRRMFFFGPDWTIEPGIVERAAVAAAPAPLDELLEIVGGWPEEAAALAAEVAVPVQYVAFEYEQLWTINPGTVADFAHYFTAAPSVTADLLSGIGHCADHHRGGTAFQLRQLAFALDSAEAATRPVEAGAAPA